MATSTETARLEEAATQSRSRLDANLNELQARLSPGQMLDQTLGLVRDNGGEFGRNLGRRVRDNPLPLVLTGIGLVWLMASDGRSSHGRPAVPDFGEPYGGPGPYGTPERYGAMDENGHDDVAAQAETTAAALRRRAGETSEAFQTRVDEERARIVGLKRDLDETAASFRQRIEDRLADARRSYAAARERAGRLTSQTGERAAAFGRSARERGESGGRQVAALFEDQPLVLGALGVALGAVFGMLLPGTDRENIWMGETRDDVADHLRERGTRAAQGAARAAGAGWDTARAKASDEGLDADGVTRTAESVRRVVEDTAHAAHDAARREIDDPSQARPSEGHVDRPV